MRTFAEKPKATQQCTVARSVLPNHMHFRENLEVSSIFSRQRIIGNQVEQNLMQTRSEELNAGLTGTLSPRFGHDFSRIPIHSGSSFRAVQTKLSNKIPEREFTEETCSVPEQIMCKPDPQLQRGCPCDGGYSKYQCDQTSHELFQTRDVQQKDSNESTRSLIIREGLPAHSHPQAATTRDVIESRFNFDFSKIRSHTNAQPVESIFCQAIDGPYTSVPHQQEMEVSFGERFDNVQAYLGRAREMNALGALAATRGTRIAFRDTNPSRETVAHELVHVIQQRRSGTLSFSSPVNLSEPGEPGEREATRIARLVVQGYKVQVAQSVNGRIARQEGAPVHNSENEPAKQSVEIPSEIVAKIKKMIERSDTIPDDNSLGELGQMAVRLLGPQGVTALARQAGVRGAERREREAESEFGGTIHRQAAEAAAATAGTMWWLTLVDGPLPIGDIIYGALILTAALAASQALRRCRCTIRYAPPDIMSQCPHRVYGTGITMHDCQNVAKFTAPQQCRQYYGHCGWMP